MDQIQNVGQTVDKILSRYNNDKGLLVSILQDVQAEYRYLPREAIEEISRKLSLPVSQIYGVATFFKAFSLKPRGKIVCQVCLGTACHIRGGPLILEKMERELKIKSGNTTEDLEWTLESVNCVGACALGPIIVTNDEIHGNMTTIKVDSLLRKIRRKPKSEVQ
jgi:NADH-quinone oxidoreductase subunit E